MSTVVTEVVDPTPARALGALLGVDVPDLETVGLPLTWHWIYFLDRPAEADLGEDGHPIRNTLVAPAREGQRRMWARGRVRTHRPLVVGAEATKESTIASTTQKQGGSGRLTFVTVRHRILQGGEVAVEEEQDIVYRDRPGPGAAAASGDAIVGAEVTIDPARHERATAISPTLLFRFSALTYNGHRIHYDRDYVRHVEGYPGLLTHGPLQAMSMAEAFRLAGEAGSFTRLDYRYRLVAPLYDFQGLVAGWAQDAEGAATYVRDLAGRRTAAGVIKPA